MSPFIITYFETPISNQGSTFYEYAENHNSELFRSTRFGYSLTLRNHILQDIEPICQETNRDLFEDGNPLTHPDSDNQNRYVMGTRLQLKTGHKGHKRETCAFHNLDLSQQGPEIKSMTQESMQNVRKFRSIQQDKLREGKFNEMVLNNVGSCILESVKK